jgi:hypothetical protein
MSLAGDLITMAEQDVECLINIFTGDETWCYLYDRRPKCQSYECMSQSASQKQKCHLGKSKDKIILKIFYDIGGYIHYEFIPEGPTLSKEMYIIWENGHNFILLPNNTSAY